MSSQISMNDCIATFSSIRNSR